MLTVGSASLATWEVASLRQTLARAVAFSRRYHRRPYTLGTLRFEIAAGVEWFDEDAFTLPSYLLSEPGELPKIKLNTLLHGTPLHILAILHECCHLILGHRRSDCTGKIESRDERDVWLASALVAVSAPLIRLVLEGFEDVSEIAWRCRVPEPLVQIRAGLAVMLGEYDAPLGEALDLIRYQLGRLELWIERMKAWARCRALVTA
jgi:hypothetical protein